MVAPGANFEFFEAPSFKSRTQDLPDLVAAIETHVRDHFDRLKVLTAEAREGEVSHQGQRFGYVVIRLRGSRLTLQQVWDAATQELDRALLDEALKARRRK